MPFSFTLHRLVLRPVGVLRPARALRDASTTSSSTRPVACCASRASRSRPPATGFPDMQAEINAATYLVPPVQGVAEVRGADGAAQNVGTTPRPTTPAHDHRVRHHRSHAMNAVTNTWRQLVRRRLWPVALLLVAALVAVPVAARPRARAAPEPLAPARRSTTEADDTIAEPVVAEVAAEDRSRRRRVLGVRKDPFEPAPVKKAKAAKQADDRRPPGTPDRRRHRRQRPTPVTPAASPRRSQDATTSPARSSSASARRRATTLKRFAITKLGAAAGRRVPAARLPGPHEGRQEGQVPGRRRRSRSTATATCKPHPASCETIELARRRDRVPRRHRPGDRRGLRGRETDEESRTDARDPRTVPARPRRHQARRRLRRSIGVCAIRRGSLGSRGGRVSP